MKDRSGREVLNTSHFQLIHSKDVKSNMPVSIRTLLTLKGFPQSCGFLGYHITFLLRSLCLANRSNQVTKSSRRHPKKLLMVQARMLKTLSNRLKKNLVVTRR